MSRSLPPPIKLFPTEVSLRDCPKRTSPLPPPNFPIIMIKLSQVSRHVYRFFASSRYHLLPLQLPPPLPAPFLPLRPVSRCSNRSRARKHAYSPPPHPSTLRSFFPFTFFSSSPFFLKWPSHYTNMPPPRSVERRRLPSDITGAFGDPLCRIFFASFLP